MAIITSVGNRLVRRMHAETLWIEPWGNQSLRIRVTKKAHINEELDFALLPPTSSNAEVKLEESSASITNGNIKAIINERGWVTFYNQYGKMLLKEYWRVKEGGDKTCALDVPGRELKPLINNEDYEISMRFEAADEEKLFGLGQRQEEFLDLKGGTFELAHRNSQASVPFVISNRGYGMLWNNPAVGQVTFAKNVTEWKAKVAEQLDYWITANDTPAQTLEAYADATGKVPMMPEYGTGFWQSRLRYQTQEELLSVAREFKKRNLPISVIVCDFFHWTQQGEWKFDSRYWPDPQAMILELKEMGIELMVSIWPTVCVTSENYDEMEERNLLLRTERGTQSMANFLGNLLFFDSSNPEAREYVWNKAKKNYYDIGTRIFWLDEAEPELMGHYDFDHIRYYIGPATKVTNLYPFYYAKAFYDGMSAAGQENIINLIRCVWAGSQRFGTLLWSGDIHANFETLRRQVAAGLSAGLSGIPWWTTDIGGFTGGDGSKESFRELYVRWFQFGVFCPVTRAHGFREPVEADLEGGWREYTTQFGTGAPNEPWSFGGEVYEILKNLLQIREKLRPYIMEQMKKAHETGTPVIRPLFYDFPQDKACWDIDHSYMFGPDILVAPILFEGARERSVYLPKGCNWTDAHTKKSYEGGLTVICQAPLDIMPVFYVEGKEKDLF